MAGRGVDIKLGGNPVDKDEEKQVIDAGGLFVLGTERHESRRIDNQLRGRSARQGDPGMTQFFVSTEDDLMRIFAGDRMKNVMERLNVPEDMPIEQKMITKMLESAQKKVEGHHFDTRKHVLQYDDVLNRHRSVIYSRRKKILELAESMNGGNPTTPPQSSPYKGEEADIDVEEENFASLKDMVMDLIEAEIEHVVSYHTNLEKDTKEWDLNEIYETMRTIFPFSEEEKQKMFRLGEGNGHGKLEDVELRDAIVEFLLEKARQTYVSLEQKVATTVGGVEDSEKVVRSMEKALLLRAIDTLWVEHLESVAHVRQGIGLQGYGQRDPLVEYKKETFFLFNDMLANIQKEVVYSFFKLNIGLDLAPSIMSSDKMTLEGAKKDMSEQGEHIEKKERDETGEKVGRNDPCTCGSGKKYKKCHGK